MKYKEKTITGEIMLNEKLLIMRKNQLEEVQLQKKQLVRQNQKLIQKIKEQ